MEVKDQVELKSETEEIYKIIWETIQSIPSHLMSSKHFANSIIQSLMNILVRIADILQMSEEKFMMMMSEIWLKYQDLKTKIPSPELGGQNGKSN